VTKANLSNDLTLAGLVHDLNNVFETISEASEVILADPQWIEVAEAIQRSVESGRRIVGCYAGTNRSGADLDVVVARAATFLNDFLHHMPGVQVRLLSRVPPGLRLGGEPNDWERVFMNLFLNAAQAMREGGGGEVEISAHANRDVVEIRIQDNGPGIPEAILAQIFEPRFSTRNSHTGLGLHIVHSIVEENNGSVRAENRSGASGAIFTLSAPLIASDSAD
jgi:two-component system, NtrC family, sensor kinase